MTSLSFNAMDTRYRSLTPVERDDLNRWLISCGGRPGRTRQIDFGEGFINAHEVDDICLPCEEWTFSVRRYRCPTPPPVWPALRSVDADV